MLRRFLLAGLLAGGILTCAITNVSAQWIENGTPITNPGNDDNGARIAPDGSGGAIITWSLWPTRDIYAQRVDDLGNVLWTPGGVPICVAVNSQVGVECIPDGAGGAIMAWWDQRTGTYDIYAQRVNASGNVLWTTGGVPVSAATGAQLNPRLASDGSGGAIVAWEDSRSGAYHIYAQRVNATGIPQWTANGVAICTAGGSQGSVDIVCDGYAGAILTWKDSRADGGDIYAQRVDSLGNVQWAANGVGVCTEAEGQFVPQIVTDGSDGAIITWVDIRNTVDTNIYAQHISGFGSVQWTPGGEPVCIDASTQSDVRIVAVPSRGAVAVWVDGRNGVGNDDLYAQRIDGLGSPLWTVDGVVICNANGNQSSPRVAEDALDGAIVTWQDNRSGNLNVYAGRVDASGNAAWSTAGIPLAVAPGNQNAPFLVADGRGGAIVAWSDSRSGGVDAYAQRIERNGYWGYPAPAIADVRDVPGDQGGFVNLSWDASRLDPWPEQSIDHYTVWRAIPSGAVAPLVDAGALLLASAAELSSEVSGPVVRIERSAAGTYYWTLVSTVNAYYLESYAEVVPTLFDSTAASSENHYFQVIAHASDPTMYWIGAPDSGYSIDNLAPAQPQGLSGEQAAAQGITLTWLSNTEPDLAHYAVYRGTSAGFVPGPGNLIASPPDTTTLDGGWQWSSGFYYKVSAIDVHGNESLHAVLGPGLVTGIETASGPRATYLAQNYPNPFNPTTVITYGLTEATGVSLTIYDVSGKLVRVLVDGLQEARHYQLEWDGRDSRGAALASGVYFYRLTAGEFVETRKMVLLK